MSDELQGERVAFLVANSGVEQVELTTPWQAVEDAGGTPVLIAPEKGDVQAFTNDVEKADTFQAELSTKDAAVEDYAALVLPGGTTNPDQLRTDINAVTLVAAFAGAGKPIAAICHGPWTLVEAGVVRGKTVTSWPSLKTDLRNAGVAEWRDEEVVVSKEAGYTLITSRNPGDLDAFSTTLVDVVAGSTTDTDDDTDSDTDTEGELMTDADKAAKLVELAKDIHIAMLTTVDDDGHLTSRPMAHQEVEPDGDLWFFVEKSSPTAANLALRPQAGVSLSSNDTWISLSGTAEVVEDVARAKQLWNSWVEAWLPQGPEDDSVALIHFRADAGEYWDTPGGRVASALSFVKAKVTGDRYQGGENETVTLST